MSDVKKCDRCGSMYEPGGKTRMIFEYFWNGLGRTKNGGDMCQKCTEKFHKWWNKERKEDGE